jgi:hypothetical protein
VHGEKGALETLRDRISNECTGRHIAGHEERVEI